MKIITHVTHQPFHLYTLARRRRRQRVICTYSMTRQRRTTEQRRQWQRRHSVVRMAFRRRELKKRERKRFKFMSGNILKAFVTFISIPICVHFFVLSFSQHLSLSFHHSFCWSGSILRPLCTFYNNMCVCGASSTPATSIACTKSVNVDG